MKELFERCLKAHYVRTPESGDYAIEVDDGTLYLLFQKSNGKQDWKNNFDFPAKPYKRMNSKWYCHRGFLRVWKAMRDEVEKNVATWLPYITSICCVGYSHGAALALLATEDMVFLHGDKLRVEGWGFGCPRVVWGILPKDVKQRLRNFTAVRNIPDIVTHAPPALFGFHHVKLLRVGNFGKYSPVDAHRAKSYLNELGKEGGDTMKIGWKRKLTSRKFWISLAAFVSGLIIALRGDAQTAETVSGCIMSAASVIAYAIGEGLADSSNKDNK